MLEIGKEYYFKYPNIKLDNGSNNSIEYEVDLIALIPVDYDYSYGNDPYIIKYILNKDINNICYIKYYDKPTIRGRGKWILHRVQKTLLTVSDLPTAVDSSLNTFEHPSKRKWFRHLNFGFSRNDYDKIDWENWLDYPLMIEYNDITLLYRIICDIIKNKDPLEDNFDILKDKVSHCFILNYPFNMKKDLLEEYHENYLKDIMKIW